MSGGRPKYDVPEECNLVEDTDYRLLLDIDSSSGLVQFLEHFMVLEPWYPVDCLFVWPSRGGNLHILIEFEKAYSFFLRMAMQLSLGSDPLRTTLALFEGKAGNVLFKPHAEETTTD